jgi:integrase
MIITGAHLQERCHLQQQSAQPSGYELIPRQEIPIDHNPAAVYLYGLNSDHSRRNLSRYLNQVAAFLTNDQCDLMTLNWAAMRQRHVAVVAAWFAEEYAPSTVNGMLAAVRGVLKAAHELGQVTSNDYHDAIQVPNVRARRKSSGRELTHQEIQNLLAACGADNSDNDAKGTRDAAIVALLYATGMRRSELVQLYYDHYTTDTGQLIIQAGQGEDERTVYLKSRPKELLDVWLQRRGAHGGPLFQPVNKAGRIRRNRGISDQAVYNMIKARAAEADIKSFSPQDLRRTFVAGALRAGVDPSTVADIAGHASTDTTRRYKPRDEH